MSYNTIERYSFAKIWMTTVFSIIICKVEPYKGDDDNDTALNGIKLYCEKYNGASELLSKRYITKF